MNAGLWALLILGGLSAFGLIIGAAWGFIRFQHDRQTVATTNAIHEQMEEAEP